MTRLGLCVLAVVSMLIAPAVMYAEVQVNDSTEISMLVGVPCAGETVLLTGPLHTLVTYTINDNKVSGKSHSQPQGISGVGSVSGAKYQGTGVTQSRFEGSLQNGQYNYTFVNNFRIIGQGTGNNLLVHMTTHITVNANGEVTVVHDNASAECK